MKKMAALVICLSSTLHAQECIAPVDQYVGILFDDGRCLPWSKQQEKLLSDNTPRCTPDLRGPLESPFPKIVNGAFVDTKECVPDALRYRPERPHPPSPEELQRSIDELKDEIEQLKSERH
jgi:hypothetical protein